MPTSRTLLRFLLPGSEAGKPVITPAPDPGTRCSRAGCSTKVGSPVVSKRGTRNVKQPGAATVRITLKIEALQGLEKDLRRQILSCLSVSYLAIHVAVDGTKIFLRH